ncbi:MAG: nucleotide exchange factor GrpE [bacterium]|nr:nucleotide exchange factor GrpE [bacterium]
MNILKRGDKAQKIHSHITPNEEEMKLKEEAETNLAGWKRAMADYENLHRRMGEENMKARMNGTEEALRSMLQVLDYFDAAFTTIPEEISKNEWVIGMTNIQKAFLNALQTQGVEPIDATAVPFDPKYHEAVEHIKDETKPAGTVLTVVSKGYQLGNKVLRPAKVKVSDNPTVNDE